MNITADETVKQIRITKPLVHSITNYVSMDLMANTLLAIGASPIMAHAPEEVEELVQLSSVLVVNIGTLSSSWIDSMKKAVVKAKSLNKPWILDPVGCGASVLRTRTCVELIGLHSPTVVRGNASEIIALERALHLDRAKIEGDLKPKGVDSCHQSDEAVQASLSIALSTGSVVAITGKVDFVTDGKTIIEVHNGVEMFTKVTAAGCALTGIVGSFVAVKSSNPLVATAEAIAVYGLCGEEAAAVSSGPGSFRMHFLDKLYNIDSSTIRSKVNIQQYGDRS